MRTLFLISILLLSKAILPAQKKVDISNMNTLVQAQEFIQSNPESGAELLSLVQGDHFVDIPPLIFTKKPGYTFTTGNYTYKLVDIGSVISFRVSYIFLAGEKYSKTEADELREQIISRYRSGVKFTTLVQKYNMDGNTTGDTNWFTEKMMVSEFEKAVKEHKKGEIFTVDTPGKNWYHVVLKTHNDNYVKKVTLLKLPASN